MPQICLLLKRILFSENIASILVFVFVALYCLAMPFLDISLGLLYLTALVTIYLCTLALHSVINTECGYWMYPDREIIYSDRGTFIVLFGDEPDFLDMGKLSREKKELEIISYASTQHLTGKIFAVAQGRHEDCLYAMRVLGFADPVHGFTTCDFGFLTNYGRFLDEVEALTIACKAKQLIRTPQDKLTTQDLW